MSYEEIRQAEENDRLDWLAAREAEVRAFADEECPVCDGDGYTTGVTVRHPCPNCNPDFRLDRATDRLVEVGAAAAVHTPLPWEAIEINHDLRRWQIVHFDERRSAHYVTDIAPTYGTGTDEHEANAHLIVEAVNGYAALQERLEAAERHIEALKAEVVTERAAAERSNRMYREFVGDPKKAGREEAVAENGRIYDEVMRLRTDLGIENDEGNYGLLTPIRGEIERLRAELASNARVEDELFNARRAAEYDAARAEAAERLNGELRTENERLKAPLIDPFEDVGQYAERVITGVGGLHDFEKYEWAIRNGDPDVAVAIWVLKCLANPNSADSAQMLEAIHERRARIEAESSPKDGE